MRKNKSKENQKRAKRKRACKTLKTNYFARSSLLFFDFVFSSILILVE